MVVVRESPDAKLSPSKNPAQWPPRSPFQALLSSPSGRRKWQDQKSGGAARETSPSPTRKTLAGAEKRQALSVASDEGIKDEDEEILQLQLQEIQAKLKLKKLQKTRQTTELSGGKENAVPRSVSKALKRPSIRDRQDDALVEVPLSPSKGRDSTREQQSPARKRLGLDVGPGIHTVSLKRARNSAKPSREVPFSSPSAAEQKPALTPISFSERLKRSKAESRDREAKQDRIEQLRSTGFGSSRKSEGEHRTAGTSNETPSRRAMINPKLPSSTQVRDSTSYSTDAAGLNRSGCTKPSRSEKPSRFLANELDRSHAKTRSRGDKGDAHDADQNQETSDGFDLFSQIHLSKRHIPHVDVARAFQSTEVYPLPRLLKEVKSPHYDPPDCESDFVVLAVLASKSTPFDQKATHRTSESNKPQEDANAPRNKFMVLHLTDLKWEIDCFLFGTAFDQFWKLVPGTLLAILNPAIMPPKTNQHNGRFSLKLGSCEDCVMEIGVARDLAYCESVRKDGQKCTAWVDKRSTGVCEFHLNLMIDRERKHRMEVNGMWRGHGNTTNEARARRSRDAADSENKTKDKHRGKSYHPEYGHLYSVSTGLVKSAASLLDAEDRFTPSSISSEEASRKRLAAAQRERDLAARLGEMGSGIGAEYLRAKHNGHSSGVIRSSDIAAADAKALFEKPSASELGLLANKASAQHLSPAKDRKRHFGLGAVGSAGTEAMGWGGARKAGLLQPPLQQTTRSPERTRVQEEGRRQGIVRARSQDGSVSPKKRARFALEKGIREPGRESLGQDMLNEESDGELEIV